MSLLLDTNVFLWAAEKNPRLTPRLIERLMDPNEVVYVSAVSAWEISTKWSKGQIKLPQEPDAFLRSAVANAGYSQLSISFSHAAAVGLLPNHHKDPFDRLIIVQARATGFRVLTSDRVFLKYDVEIVLP